MQKIILIISLTLFLIIGMVISADAADTVICLEAEDGIFDDPYSVISNSAANGGKAVRVESSASRSSVSKETPVDFTIEFEVPERGVYFIWCRGKGTGTKCTQFMSVDGATHELMSFNENDNNYNWVCFNWYPLDAGKHTINVLYSVGDVYIDCFEITQAPEYTPTGEERFPVINAGYYNIPAYTPPAEHPRIEFRAQDLPRIRENLNHPQNAETYQELLRVADKNIDDAWTGILDYGVKTNLNTVYGHVIEANAFLYQLHGDKQRGLNAIKWAKNYISSTGLQRNNNITQIERSGMYVSYIVAKVYDWCYDLLTEEDKEFLETFMLLRMEMVGAWPPSEGTLHINSKVMETWLLRESLASSIAMYDERQDVYNHIAGRILDKIVPVKNYIDRSIFQWEGTSYGGFRLQFQVEAALLFKGMGYENIWDATAQHFAPYGNFYLWLPTQKYFSHADDAYESSWGFKASYEPLMFLAGNMYKDPYLKGYYYFAKSGGFSNEIGIDQITPVRHLIHNDVNVGVGSLRDLPLSIYSNDPGGWMAARTSWDMGADSDTVACMMHIKQLNLESHSHNDSGSFDIFYKGYLALDSGIYQGVNNTYTSDHNRNYGSQTIAHNTMLIEDPDEPLRKYTKVQDGGQRGNACTSTWYAKEYEDLFSEEVIFGDVLSHNFGPDPMEPAYTYMKGDMTAAYTDKVENFQRTFMFLNFFDEDYPAALIVFDDLTTSDPSFKKKWLIHSQEEPTIYEEDKSFTIKRTELMYNGRLINQALLPENVEFTKVGGPGHEFEVGGINWAATPTNPKTTDSGNWRIEVSPSAEAKQDYFLNVMQISENDDSIVPLNATIIENNDEFVGVHIKDRAVYFKKDGKTRAYELAINDNASDEQCMYIITSLAEGSWTVYDSKDNPVYTQDVTEDHDSLSFTGKRGKYTLRWSYKNNIKSVDLTLPALLSFEPKADIDVKVGSFFETFDEPFEEIDGVLYAPVGATLKKLEIEYLENDGVFNVNGGHTFSKETDKSIVSNDILYIEAESFLDSLGIPVSYDPIGRIARISYTGRQVDSIFDEEKENSESKSTVEYFPYINDGEENDAISDRLKITSINVTNIYGEQLTSAAAGSSVYVSCRAKAVDGDEKVGFIAAAYNDADKLICTSISDEFILGKNAEDVGVCLNIPMGAETATKFRTFIWDGFSTLRPLVKYADDIDEVNILGVLFNGVTYNKDVYSHEVSLDAYELSVPDVQILTDNPAARVEVVCSSPFPISKQWDSETATANITASVTLNGETKYIYTFIVTQAIPEITNAKMYEWNAGSGTTLVYYEHGDTTQYNSETGITTGSGAGEFFSVNKIAEADYANSSVKRSDIASGCGLNAAALKNPVYIEYDTSSNSKYMLYNIRPEFVNGAVFQRVFRGGTSARALCMDTLVLKAGLTSGASVPSSQYASYTFDINRSATVYVSTQANIEQFVNEGFSYIDDDAFRLPYYSFSNSGTATSLKGHWYKKHIDVISDEQVSVAIPVGHNNITVIVKFDEFENEPVVYDSFYTTADGTHDNVPLTTACLFSPVLKDSNIDGTKSSDFLYSLNLGNDSVIGKIDEVAVGAELLQGLPTSLDNLDKIQFNLNKSADVYLIINCKPSTTSEHWSSAKSDWFDNGWRMIKKDKVPIKSVVYPESELTDFTSSAYRSTTTIMKHYDVADGESVEVSLDDLQEFKDFHLDSDNDEDYKFRDGFILVLIKKSDN